MTVAIITAEAGPAISFAVMGGGLLLVLVGIFKWTGRKRYPSRPCPRCGNEVVVGMLDCPSCDFDFRTIGC